MTTITSPLPDEARTITGAALQGALVDLIDLSLLAKQAHWNLVGRNFRSLHLLLDEVVAVARTHSDVVAERAVAIGVNPDGRPETILKGSQSKHLESGYISDTDVIDEFSTLLGDMVARFHDAIAETEQSDPISQDLLIQAAHDLAEKHWMFQAQQQ